MASAEHDACALTAIGIFGRGVAIPETLSALSASVWSMVLGFKMLKEAVH